MNRRRMMMGQGGGEILPPANQIWYDADAQVTLYSQTNVISHTFENGRGVVTFGSDITTVNNNLATKTNITRVYLPNSVNTIRDGAFFGCSSLIFINLPDGITQIKDNAFYNCNKLNLVSLPKDLVSLGNSVFYDNRSLTLSSLPEGLLSMGSNCFYRTKISITSLPSGLTSIPTGCFQECTHLSITSLPVGITSIAANAFYNTGIKSLTIPIITPPTLGSLAFYGTSGRFYVPAESVEAYKVADGWSGYANRIFAIPE